MPAHKTSPVCLGVCSGLLSFHRAGAGDALSNSRHCKDGTFVRTCRLVCRGQESRWLGAFALWSPLSRLSAGEASEKVMLTILGFEWAIWYCQPFVFNRPGLDLSGFSYVSCSLRGGVRQPWVRMPALLSTGCKPWEDDPRLSDPVISFVQHVHCSFIHLLGGVSHFLHAYLVRACSGCFFPEANSLDCILVRHDIKKRIATEISR